MSVGCDEVVGLEEEEEGEDHPEHVEEDEVDPEIEPVGGVQVGIVCQPLRTKGHPAYERGRERGGFMIQSLQNKLKCIALLFQLCLLMIKVLHWLLVLHNQWPLVTSSICKSISKVLEPCSQGLLDFLMKAPEIRLGSLTSIQLTHVHHNLDKMPAETQNSVVHRIV